MIVNWFPTGIYLLKANKINTRTRCEICSKLTIKTPERRRCRSGVFVVNFERRVSTVNFAQVIAGWVKLAKLFDKS